MGRITKVELFRAPMPMKVPFKVAIGVTTTSQSLFVRVHCDDGVVGLGEGNIFTPVTGETPDSVWATAPDSRLSPARGAGGRRRKLACTSSRRSVARSTKLRWPSWR